jgi:SET domain
VPHRYFSINRFSQWQRDDPIHNLIRKYDVAGSADYDDEAIASCVDELHAMHPYAPKHKMKAALYIRLMRFDGLNRIFGLERMKHDDALKLDKNISGSTTPQLVSAASMYSIVTSRAIELHNGLSGVIPFFDMINHSMSPNLVLKFDGSTFELHATRDIQANEELFICYHAPNRQWDEDQALWTPIQWGFPDPKPIVAVPETVPIERKLTTA